MSAVFVASCGFILGLFSGFGRCLFWETDNVVEFVPTCNYFMVNERFLSVFFRFSFPPNYCQSFLESQFCEELFTLKLSGYLCLARNVIDFASRESVEIYISEDFIVSASSTFSFQLWLKNT